MSHHVNIVKEKNKCFLFSLRKSFVTQKHGVERWSCAAIRRLQTDARISRTRRRYGYIWMIILYLPLFCCRTFNKTYLAHGNRSRLWWCERSHCLRYCLHMSISCGTPWIFARKHKMHNGWLGVTRQQAARNENAVGQKEKWKVS